MIDNMTETIQERLEYLRGELRAERLSWGEVHELQTLAEHIDPNDIELLEAAGVPEFDDEDEETRSDSITILEGPGVPRYSTAVFDSDGTVAVMRDGSDIMHIRHDEDGSTVVTVFGPYDVEAVANVGMVMRVS